MDIEATEYPLATDELHKGSRVTAAVIEHAFGVLRGSPQYQLRLLSAREYIAKRLADRGEPATVIQDGDEIVILTDAEASVYNAHRFRLTRRAGERAFRRLGQVDRANLSEDARREHDRSIVVIGRRIQADHKARREVTLRAAGRVTPALTEGNE